MRFLCYIDYVFIGYVIFISVRWLFIYVYVYVDLCCSCLSVFILKNFIVRYKVGGICDIWWLVNFMFVLFILRIEVIVFIVYL